MNKPSLTSGTHFPGENPETCAPFYPGAAGLQSVALEWSGLCSLQPTHLQSD